MNAGRNGRARHLRLVHPRRPIMSPSELAQFKSPKTWEQIRLLQPQRGMSWWRAAIIDAELEFDLLTWAPDDSGQREKGTWTLTANGRAYVAKWRG